MQGPIAVPSSCKWNFSLNTELLHCRYNLRASKIHSAGRKFIFLLPETASKLETLWLLGNILTISKVTKTESSVRILLSFILSIIFNVSGISFFLESIFLTSLYKYFSTKIDKYSIAVPHPLVITLTG